MKIGIEAERANIVNATGVEHYAQQMILNLAKLNTEDEFVLYLRTLPKSWMKDLPKNFSIKVLPFPAFWTQIRLSMEIIAHPVDALFIMASALPLIHPKNSVVTIHDLAWKFYPETFPPKMRRYLEFSTKYAISHSKKVIAVSEQTRKDIIEFYNLSEEKVVTIHHGFDSESELNIKTGSQEKEELKKIENLPEKFMLYLGTLQPRKNITGLIDAFEQLQKENHLNGYKLVIAGGKGWLYKEIMKRISGNSEIIYFGYVYDRFALLKKSSILVQPAFYEGFGLQVLDAFYAGVPVACSNVSSLPEVAGSAAKYFDPNDHIDMAHAIKGLIDSQTERDRLVEAGKKRLAEFSWIDTAKKTLSILKEEKSI